MNLSSNKTQLVGAQSTERGVEHAVVINLSKVIETEDRDLIYKANFGSSLSGINPFTGLADIVNPITSLFLRNNDISSIEFKNNVLGNITLVSDNSS
jgi:hypothetical protein